MGHFMGLRLYDGLCGAYCVKPECLGRVEAMTVLNLAQGKTVSIVPLTSYYPLVNVT